MVHAARDVDELIAAEWDLEELLEPLPISAATAAPEEQDELIEAIALANAERERELIEKAAELERRVTDAYAEGYEAGQRTGELEEGARVRNAVAVAERALDEVRAGEPRWAGAIEENLCALAVGIARQLLGRELAGDTEVVPELVRHALTEFPLDQPVRIRVNPVDLAAISGEAADGAASLIAPPREARWLADPQIAPGGCVVEGRERIVDGRVDSALERIFRQLTDNRA